MNAANRLPPELPLLILRGMVVFPLTVTPLAVSRPAAVRLIDDSIISGGQIAIAAQRGDNADACYLVGVVATAHRLVRLHDGTLRIALQAADRIAIDAIIAREPYPRAHARYLPDPPESIALAPLMEEARARANELLDALTGTHEEVRAQIESADDPQRLAALLASTLLVRAGLAERQTLLEMSGVGARLTQLCSLLNQEIAVLRGHLRI